ncbi:hypothetical protein LOTGIDRAFT_175710 [Lottia gigantea]|uniref:Uncharacterized protein n=1 Tax=Lottia gigantea TaxID=225164 RepID=V3ZLQ3_LOTGI|nr:hypothetical protein LOTGIDRAFT_175710 [Lottia gigantea]ESO92288.1 hypothetical protein LOTGIDRAFT_175710 [Lottia gigantea]
MDAKGDLKLIPEFGVLNVIETVLRKGMWILILKDTLSIEYHLKQLCERCPGEDISEICMDIVVSRFHWSFPGRFWSFPGGFWSVHVLNFCVLNVIKTVILQLLVTVLFLKKVMYNKQYDKQFYERLKWDRG